MKQNKVNELIQLLITAFDEGRKNFTFLMPEDKIEQEEVEQYIQRLELSYTVVDEEEPLSIEVQIRK